MDCLFESDIFIGNEFPLRDSIIKSLEPKVNIRDKDSEFIVEVSPPGYDTDEIIFKAGDNILPLLSNKKRL